MSKLPHQTTSDPDTSDFLIEEFKNLFALDTARNERLDRLLTLFLSMAGAPWALYALTIKEGGSIDLMGMPKLIAILFLVVGLLGFLVVAMYIQTRFLIIDYMRAVNAIRGYLTKDVEASAVFLPTSKEKPPFIEKGSFITIAVRGMALVDFGYVLLGLYRLVPISIWRWFVIIPPALGWLAWHRIYYRRQGSRREADRRKHSGRMDWRMPK